MINTCATRLAQVNSWLKRSAAQPSYLTKKTWFPTGKYNQVTLLFSTQFLTVIRKNL